VRILRGESDPAATAPLPAASMPIFAPTSCNYPTAASLRQGAVVGARPSIPRPLRGFPRSGADVSHGRSAILERGSRCLQTASRDRGLFHAVPRRTSASATNAERSPPGGRICPKSRGIESQIAGRGASHAKVAPDFPGFARDGFSEAPLQSLQWHAAGCCRSEQSPQPGPAAIRYRGFASRKKLRAALELGIAFFCG
jgi:hypothetical protein